jgi:hypothetical protein
MNFDESATSGPNQHPGDEGERLVPPQADRAPTPEEEQAAERAASGVDLGAVTPHEKEMAERGAHVKGEGQIE